MKRVRIVGLCLAVAFTSSAAVTSTGWAATYAAHVVGGEYVALGDSFSSGEGAPPYEGLPNEPEENGCHRSPKSWPPLVAAALPSNPFKFDACSGALIQAFYTVTTYKRYIGRQNAEGKLYESEWKEPEQFVWLAPSELINPEVKLVTFSIGGNNVGFGEIIEKCVSRNQFYEKEKSKDEWKALNTKCDTEGTATVTAGIAFIEGAKGLTYILDRAHQQAPNAWIRVLLYPTIMSDTTFKGSTGEDVCQLGSTVRVYVSKDEIKYFDKWQKSLNKAIETIVKTFGKPLNKKEAHSVELVMAEKSFANANLCSASNTFVNPITLLQLVPPIPYPESAHPTAAGYKVLAEATLKTLEE